MADIDCDDATFCNGVETCDAGVCIAGPGDLCLATSDPFCDEGLDICFQCLADLACSGENICEQGVCLAPVGVDSPWLPRMTLITVAGGVLRQRRNETPQGPEAM